jgi:hypothetical protein
MKSIMIVNSSVVANGSDSGSGIGSGDGAEETSMGVLLISNSHVIATSLGNGHGCGIGTGRRGSWYGGNWYECDDCGMNTIDMVMILNSTVIASALLGCGIGTVGELLVISSSEVEATSSAGGCGIRSAGGLALISSSQIGATGSGSGSGIGTPSSGTDHMNMTIWNSTLVARASSGSGIGTVGGDLLISDSEIEATSSEGGYGIRTGGSMIDNVTILNSTVVAHGSGSGIGSGLGMDSIGILLISSSDVIATSHGEGYGCGIGIGRSSCTETTSIMDDVKILNSTVQAKASSGSGIRTVGGYILISNSKVEASGSG